MKTQPLHLALTLVLAIATFAGRAHAQDQNLNAARASFDEGQALFLGGQYLEAAQKFQAAYEARPFAQFLFNIGACYEKAAKYSMALEFYSRYLKEAPDAPDKKKTQQRIDALKKGLDEIKGAADPGQAPEAIAALGTPETVGLIVIESDPQGAWIYLDSKKNKPLSKTPWNGTLSGEHVIMLEREGYKPVEKRISPDPNKLMLVFWGLAEEDYLGWLDVTANVPGADIYIDDKSVGAKAKTPWSGNLAPGKHKIWVTKEGYSEYAIDVEVIAGQTHKITAALEGSEVGYLNVRGKDVERVKVLVDGEVLCERGPCLKPLPPGEHKVTIKRSGYKSYTQMVDVQSKTEVTMRATLAPEPSRTDAVVAYVFSGLFIGGGVWAGMRSRDIENELKDEIAAGNPPPDSEDPRFLRGKLWAIGADAAYVVGGATFIAALYYSVRDKGKPSTGSTDIRALSLSPQVAPGYAGLGMELTF